MDALLCADGPVTSLVDLTLVAEHRRGHGAMYEALNCGNVDVPQLRQVLAGLPVPRAADGRLVLAVDVSNWLRPDAPTSADRLFCHVYGRSGRSSDQFIPGWPYSFVAALESGRTSWCQLLFRLMKQTLGWTRPKLRTPEASERWTWLIIAAHTRIRLLRGAAADLRRPWEKPAEPGRLTPARVRRGFRNLRPHLHSPARAPKPSTPVPGSPLGSKNRRPATRYDVGKSVKRPESIIERNRLRG